MTARFSRHLLDDLSIDDERSFRHVALYGDLKAVLMRERYTFRVLPESPGASWDRALFLNLTFWGASEGGDVLVDAEVPADVVAHVAWHRLATRALAAAPDGRPHVDALFLGEAIASAFDLYLVGRLLGHAPGSSFLASQTAAMAEAADTAGVDDAAFATLLRGIADEPERAFASLRELLYDAARALFAQRDAEGALGVLHGLEGHRFGALIHHYELANWVLYARAYGDPAPAPDVAAVDRALRGPTDAVAWLADAWVTPALTR